MVETKEPLPISKLNFDDSYYWLKGLTMEEPERINAMARGWFLYAFKSSIVLHDGGEDLSAILRRFRGVCYEAGISVEDAINSIYRFWGSVMTPEVRGGYNIPEVKENPDSTDKENVLNLSRAEHMFACGTPGKESDLKGMTWD